MSSQSTGIGQPYASPWMQTSAWLPPRNVIRPQTHLQPSQVSSLESSELPFANQPRPPAPRQLTTAQQRVFSNEWPLSLLPPADDHIEGDYSVWQRGTRAWRPQPVRWNSEAGRCRMTTPPPAPDAGSKSANAAGSSSHLSASVAAANTIQAATEAEMLARAAQGALPVPIGSLVPLPNFSSLSAASTPRKSQIGRVQVFRPRPSPRRAKLLLGLMRDEAEDASPRLPPLPQTERPLLPVDYEVLRVALSKPETALALGEMMRRGERTGLSQIGRRPAPPSRTLNGAMTIEQVPIQ